MSKVVAMYIRLSKEDNDISKKIESESITNQKELIYDYINSKEGMINDNIIEYVDDGFSGTNTNRTAFERLLKDARNNKIKCIVVKDLSRLSRNYIEAGNFLEQVFPFLGIRFISINDLYDSDNFMGTTGGFEIAFKNLIYDLYSKDLSKKVRAGKEIKMRKGEYLGGFAPFGYKKSKIYKNKLEISDKEAEVIRHIFNLRYYENKSFSEIARELNSKKTKTPSMFFKERVDTNKFKNSSKKLMWSYSSISKIIKDRVYIGIVVGKKRVVTKIGTNESRKGNEEENIVVENMHEPIISKDIFEAVNLPFNRKKRAANKKIERVLYGKIRCGHCKRIMRRSQTKRKYYKCEYARTDLNSKHIFDKFYEDNIEQNALEAIKIQISLLKDIKIKTSKYNEKVKVKNELELKKLETQVKKIKNENLALYEQFKNNEICKEKFVVRKTERNKLAEEVNAKIKIIEISEKDNLLEESLNKIPEVITNNDIIVDELSFELVDVLVDCIYVYSNDNIEIVWKYKDLYEI